MSVPIQPTIKGRGAAGNPPNRFERMHVEDDFEHFEGDAEFLEELGKTKTEYLIDTSRSIISTNDSPDVGFTHSINVYRGCSHGCIYCYARPGHEYLGMSAGLDFETRIIETAERKAGMDSRWMSKLSTESFRNPAQKQMTLW